MSKILRLSKNERLILKIITSLLKTIIYIVNGCFKVIYISFKYLNKSLKTRRALKATGYSMIDILDKLYTISSRQFEVFCAELYAQQGYKTKLTAPTCDYGRDVILNNNIFVECKHYSKDNYIGREICQKLLGSVSMFHAKKAIIITTGKYHKNAYEVAKMVDNLELLDIWDIQDMILNLKPHQVSKIMIKTLNAS